MSENGLQPPKRVGVTYNPQLAAARKLAVQLQIDIEAGGSPRSWTSWKTASTSPSATW